jgi:hypothetical protein
MKCPECNSRITQTEYDSAFEWYECKSCEGCFTYAEILEGGVEEETNGKARPVAKGKKRRAEIAEDEEVIAEFEKEMVKPVNTDEPKISRPRDEAGTVEVCTVMAAEIQDIYSEMNVSIDEANAYDKALILWREMHAAGAVAREHAVPHAACKEHA